jgi:hypothetical protein
MVSTLLEIRVLQGFFTNTYDKPLPLGFFMLWKTPIKRFFLKPKRIFHSVKGLKKPFGLLYVLVKNPWRTRISKSAWSLQHTPSEARSNSTSFQGGSLSPNLSNQSKTCRCGDVPARTPILLEYIIVVLTDRCQIEHMGPVVQSTVKLTTVTS